MAKKTPRPGRTLLIFFLSIVVLYGLVALGDMTNKKGSPSAWKPTLGLDLQGGTRIQIIAEKAPGAVKLRQAADIIDSRVNGSGVAEAEVTTQGDRNIVVEIPGKEPRRDLVDAVKRTAQLRFRLVVGQPQPGVPITASPSATPSATPSGTSTAKPSASPTATPKPRTAPLVDVPMATVTPTPTPAATPTAPAATPTTAPTGTDQGASIDKPMEWVNNPGTEWLTKYAAFTCPKKGSAVVADDPDQPLITCNDDGAKFLLSKAIIEGTQLKSASSGLSQQGVGFEVLLSFKSDGKKAFGDATAFIAQTGGTFAIVLDGQVLSNATASQAIRDGNAQITGNFTEKSSASLANSLKFGALPIKFQSDPQVETIGPSLAGDQLSAGLLAGVIGLLIVMLYCLLYYRGLGLVVIASLILAGVVTYGVVLVLAKAAGFTLTLPGIAGLIVAVGITADSFIVYFERIRDEMRDGKSMRVAVEAGWVRARNTCLAADAVSLLAAVVLYIFAIGVVRGFAFALGISTLIDIAVFFWFTKPVMTLLAKRRFFNGGHSMSGLSAETLGVDELKSDQLVGGRA